MNKLQLELEQLEFYKSITMDQLLLVNVVDSFRPIYRLPNWMTNIISNILARKCKKQYDNIQKMIYTLEVILYTK